MVEPARGDPRRGALALSGDRTGRAGPAGAAALDRSIRLPAILAPIGDQVVVSGEPAYIDRILVRNGQDVAVGQPLLILSSPELDLGEAQAKLRIAQLQSQIARGVSDRQDLADATVLSRNLVAERDRLAGYARQRAALSPRAACRDRRPGGRLAA